MRGDEDRHVGAEGARPRPEVERLGPPGWQEFAASRRRFQQALAIQGLERAWERPAAGGAPGAQRGAT